MPRRTEPVSVRGYYRPTGGSVMDWFEDWLQRTIEKLASWLEDKK
jgi:hypothetical protein